jgi:hypothetical protein
LLLSNDGGSSAKLSKDFNEPERISPWRVRESWLKEWPIDAVLNLKAEIISSGDTATESLDRDF